MAVVKDLGVVTAYAYAVAGGYAGTEAEFTEALGRAGITVEQLENLTAVATTLAEGAEATASYADGVLTFGIPKGDTGATGPQGETGPKGDTGNGIVSIAKTATVGKADTYTITFTDGNTTTFEVTNGADGNITNVAQAFDSTKAYSVGDMVLYQGTLYAFTAAHTAGAWVGSDAQALILADEVTVLKDDLSDVNERIGNVDNSVINLELELNNKSTIIPLFVQGRFNASGYDKTKGAYVCTQILEAGIYSIINNLGTDYYYSVWIYNSDSSGTALVNETYVSTPFVTASDNIIVCIRKMSGSAISDEDRNTITNGFSITRMVTTGIKYADLISDVKSVDSRVVEIQKSLYDRANISVDYQIGRYDINGYQLISYFANGIDKLTPGTYNISSILSSNYQYAVFNYVSDAEGTVLVSYTANQQTAFTVQGLAIICVRKLDTAPFTQEEISYIKNALSIAVVEKKTNAYISLEENIINTAEINNRNGISSKENGMLKLQASGSLMDFRFTLANNESTQSVPYIIVNVYKPNTTTVSVLACEIVGTSCVRSKSLNNGWNHLVFDLYSGNVTTWPGLIIRLYATSTVDDVLFIKSIIMNKQSKAHLIFIEDGGYSNFYASNGGYEQLKAVGVPVTLALDPSLVDSGDSHGITSELIEQLSNDPYTEFSVHAWSSATPTAQMTKDELMEDNHKAFSWLRKRGLLPQKIWRAAWTQNTAPYAESCFGQMDGCATWDGSSAGLTAFPFENIYKIPRYSAHGKTTEQLDAVFDNMKKTHCTLVCYTHDISETGDYNMRPAVFAHMLDLIETGISEGWLEPTTFSRLMTLYEHGLS